MRSEQLVRVDRRYGLPPITEGAVLRHDKGLVLLFAQQREHVLHQLTQPAVSAQRAERSGVEEEEQRAETEQTSLRVPPSAPETVGRQRKKRDGRLFSHQVSLFGWIYTTAHDTKLPKQPEVNKILRWTR